MFQNAMEISKLFGIKIRIEPSWLIIAALIVWSLSSSYFPGILPEANQTTLFVISTLSMLGLFVSLILHELSHSLVARRFGLDVGSITLFIFGGVAELERDPESAKSEFWIALAGPVMSLFLGAVCFVVADIIENIQGRNNAVFAIVNYLSFINFVLAIFNLIPAFPLDGGRIFRAILWHLKKDVLGATKIARNVGNFFAFVLIMIGVLAFFSSQLVAGIWQILIGIFILSASNASYNNLIIHQSLKPFTVRALMTRSLWVANVNDSLQHLVDKIMLKNNVSFVPVLDGDTLLGYVDAAMIKTIDQDNWSTTSVGDIFVASDAANTIHADMHTEDVFDLMTGTGNRKLLISDKGKLEGVISLADLLTFLSIRSSLGLKPTAQHEINRNRILSHA